MSYVYANPEKFVRDNVICTVYRTVRWRCASVTYK